LLKGAMIVLGANALLQPTGGASAQPSGGVLGASALIQPNGGVLGVNLLQEKKEDTKKETKKKNTKKKGKKKEEAPKKEGG